MSDAEDSRPDSSITLLIVCPVRLYCEGLALVLRASPRLAVVGAAPDCVTALQQFEALGPDVLLVDVTMTGALDLVARLRKGSPAARIVAFSVQESEPQIVECIEAGASGCVACDAPVETLIDAIESAARDELVCSPRVTATLVRRLSSRLSAARPVVIDDPLTNRERQVLRLVHEGLANKEIAQRLNIAEATVKNHVHSILDKLGVASRSQAAVRFNSLAV